MNDLPKNRIFSPTARTRVFHRVLLPDRAHKRIRIPARARQHPSTVDAYIKTQRRTNLFALFLGSFPSDRVPHSWHVGRYPPFPMTCSPMVYAEVRKGVKWVTVSFFRTDTSSALSSNPKPNQGDIGLVRFRVGIVVSVVSPRSPSLEDAPQYKCHCVQRPLVASLSLQPALVLGSRGSYPRSHQH